MYILNTRDVIESEEDDIMYKFRVIIKVINSVLI